jgi:hypothetical protein
MTALKRTMQLGRLAELRQKFRHVKNDEDAFVKGILLQFEPLDMDMEYLDKLDLVKLRDNVSSLENAHNKHILLAAEIKRLEEETGETSNAL